MPSLILNDETVDLIEQDVDADIACVCVCE